MKRIIFTLLATTSISGMAMAASLNDQIVESLQSRGFGYIEIKNGPSQTKVEAIGDGQKLELVYDNASGAILKQEQERADAGDQGREGVEISSRNDDFVDGQGNDGNDDDSHDDDGNDDDSHDDDSNDDDSNDDSNDDDSNDDDSTDDDDSNDDDSDDDDSDDSNDDDNDDDDSDDD